MLLINIISKIPGNSVGSQMKVQFVSFRPEYSGPPLKVVHSNWSDRSDRFIALRIFSGFHFCNEFVKGIEDGKSHSSWLA